MKAIKFEAKTTDCIQFRIPSWFLSFERTYPLPTYYNLITMIHNLCGWEEYHDMKVSIAGTGKIVTGIEPRWRAGYSELETDEFKGKYPFRVKGDGVYHGYIERLVSSERIYDQNLRIHIVPASEEDFETIYDALTTEASIIEYINYEGDTIYCKNVSITNISSEMQEVVTDMSAFKPYSPDEPLTGTVFYPHKKYRIVDNCRTFETVKVLYIKADTKVLSQIDDDGHPVFLA